MAASFVLTGLDKRNLDDPLLAEQADKSRTSVLNASLQARAKRVSRMTWSDVRSASKRQVEVRCGFAEGGWSKLKPRFRRECGHAAQRRDFGSRGREAAQSTEGVRASRQITPAELNRSNKTYLQRPKAVHRERARQAPLRCSPT